MWSEIDRLSTILAWLAAPRLPSSIVSWDGARVGRRAAARLLAPGGFARVDVVYRATLAAAVAAGHAVRHGRVEVTAALTRLTIDATSADELRVRRRAVEAGFFRAGLWLHPQGWPDQHGIPHQVWASDRPRLDVHTLSRLRLLAEPAAAAALTPTRCGVDIDDLLRLRDDDLSTTADGGLDVATANGRYRVPPAASR